MCNTQRELTSLVLTASIPRLCISRNICSLGSAPCCSPPVLGSSLGASATIQRCLLICSTLYRLLGSSTNILRIKDSQSVTGGSKDCMLLLLLCTMWQQAKCPRFQKHILVICLPTKKALLLKVTVQPTLIYMKTTLTATIIRSYECSMRWIIGFWDPVKAWTVLLATLSRHTLWAVNLLKWYKRSLNKHKVTVVQS